MHKLFHDTGRGWSRALQNIPYLSLWLVFLLLIAGCAVETPIANQATSIPTTPTARTKSSPNQAQRNACPKTSPHPVAADIADTFDVEYSLVIGWFCDGYAFDEILLTLQIQKIVDGEMDFFIKERDRGLTWDQIWRELEITSN